MLNEAISHMFFRFPKAGISNSNLQIREGRAGGGGGMYRTLPSYIILNQVQQQH